MSTGSSKIPGHKGTLSAAQAHSLPSVGLLHMEVGQGPAADSGIQRAGSSPVVSSILGLPQAQLAQEGLQDNLCRYSNGCWPACAFCLPQPASPDLDASPGGRGHAVGQG